ncbi:MAG TPA: cytochrome B [Saprospirales bacterium]|nr:cytochrome B [Saprospirales bacterium]
MKTYIWALPTRIFHWLLVIGFTAAYLLGDADDFRNVHYAFGALVGTLVFFRLIYGLIGPGYSNFKDFPIAFKNQVDFFKNYFSKTHSYTGHNPAASMVMILIFFIGLLTGVSGFLLYNIEKGTISLSLNEEFFEESHEILANLFLLLVGLHLLGILSDFIFHRKTGTLKSIFTGFKNVNAKNTSLNSVHKVFFVLWILISLFVSFLAYGLQSNSIDHESGSESKEHYEGHDSEDDD